MRGILIPLIILIPIAELAVLFAIGGRLGALNTVCILLLAGVLGTTLLRYEGWHVWRRINAEMAAGHIPANALIDGFLVLVAGVLLILPGLLTDVLGLSLMIRPVRRLAAKWLRFRMQTRIATHFSAGFQPHDDFIDVEAHSPQDVPPPDDKLLEDHTRKEAHKRGYKSE